MRDFKPYVLQVYSLSASEACTLFLLMLDDEARDYYEDRVHQTAKNYQQMKKMMSTRLTVLQGWDACYTSCSN